MTEVNFNETSTYNVDAACAAQDKYCEELRFPHFAPYRGICYTCGMQIYSNGGYSVEYASKHLVTGCPFCHVSYVD